MTPTHISVLKDEVVEAMAANRADGQNLVFVDGTFGLGGYSRAVLEFPNVTVWGIDRDPAAARHATQLASDAPGRLHFIAGCFGDMASLLAAQGVTQVDGIMLDLGVSSPQLDEAARGFSFRADGPLDMRMGNTGPTAADIVNSYDEEDLANLIYQLGEERKSRRVARLIVDARKTAPITRTFALADLVRKAVPRSQDGIDPATRTFQALRLAVNDELGELDRGLAAAEQILAPGGRLAVVSFHSLEDSRVKAFLNTQSGRAPGPSRHQPVAAIEAPEAPTFRLLSKKPILPTDAETRRNPRARSARLRIAERTTAPPRFVKEAA
jgi:16S rRNA (cytosine1402-N4)-methyltransferase